MITEMSTMQSLNMTSTAASTNKKKRKKKKKTIDG